MTMSDSAVSEVSSCDLTPDTLYKFLISMKSSIQSARTAIIRRHARLIVKLKTMIKKATNKDDQKSLSACALKNKRKAIKLKNEVKTLKNLMEIDIGKLVLLNTKDFNTATKEGASAGMSAICRMAEHKSLVEQKQRFKDHFGESITQLPFCVKVLGAEKRSRKLRKLKADKKGRMLEYDRRLCALLKEIGGEDFAAAERLYVKVLSMKKSLEKRKKTEKAWAKAQGPLGDRKAAYEEYLKTVQEGEEKETFASYVKKMDAIEGNNEAALGSDDDDASVNDHDASEDEDADPNQLELRKKIFENLDAKFGEWNDDDDDSDISDIDDVEVTPAEFKSKSTGNESTYSRGQVDKLKSGNKDKYASQISSPSSGKLKMTKKRKRDSDDSDDEGSYNTGNNRPKLSKSVDKHKSVRDEEPRDIGSKTSAKPRGPQVSIGATPAEDKTRPSLFTLFKKTGLATKTSAPPANEKSKRKEPLDEAVKKSLYCDEEKCIPSSAFLTNSASSSGASFFQGGKDKNITTLKKLFVGNKKKIVSENEDELSEIPESIAYEKAQKINSASLAAEGASGDEEEDDMAGFNSDFLLKHEGQSLLQHMSLRGGKRRRGTVTRGGGRGGFNRSFGGDDNDDVDRFPGVGGGNQGFGGRKFDGAAFSRGRSEGGRRGRGVKRPATARYDDNDESLHPSWAAKRRNSAVVTEFKGKRTVFD